MAMVAEIQKFHKSQSVGLNLIDQNNVTFSSFDSSSKQNEDEEQSSDEFDNNVSQFVKVENKIKTDQVQKDLLVDANQNKELQNQVNIRPQINSTLHFPDNSTSRSSADFYLYNIKSDQLTPQSLIENQQIDPEKEIKTEDIKDEENKLIVQNDVLGKKIEINPLDVTNQSEDSMSDFTKQIDRFRLFCSQFSTCHTFIHKLNDKVLRKLQKLMFALTFSFICIEVLIRSIVTQKQLDAPLRIGTIVQQSICCLIFDILILEIGIPLRCKKQSSPDSSKKFNANLTKYFIMLAALTLQQPFDEVIIGNLLNQQLNITCLTIIFVVSFSPLFEMSVISIIIIVILNRLRFWQYSPQLGNPNNDQTSQTTIITWQDNLLYGLILAAVIFLIVFQQVRSEKQITLNTTKSENKQEEEDKSFPGSDFQKYNDYSQSVQFLEALEGAAAIVDKDKLLNLVLLNKKCNNQVQKEKNLKRRSDVSNPFLVKNSALNELFTSQSLGLQEGLHSKQFYQQNLEFQPDANNFTESEKLQKSYTKESSQLKEQELFSLKDAIIRLIQSPAQQGKVHIIQNLNKGSLKEDIKIQTEQNVRCQDSFSDKSYLSQSHQKMLNPSQFTNLKSIRQLSDKKNAEVSSQNEGQNDDSNNLVIYELIVKPIIFQFKQHFLIQINQVSSFTYKQMLSSQSDKILDESIDLTILNGAFEQLDTIVFESQFLEQEVSRTYGFQSGTTLLNEVRVKGQLQCNIQKSEFDILKRIQNTLTDLWCIGSKLKLKLISRQNFLKILQNQTIYLNFRKLSNQSQYVQTHVRQLLLSAEPQIKAKNLSILVGQIGIPEEDIYTDWNLYDQIMFQLIINAIQYNIQDGQIEINVSFKENQKKNSAKIITIINNTGPEIDPIVLEQFQNQQKQIRLYNPKFKTDRGIGLVIAGQLARCLGGKIKIQSSKVSGTKIVIKIPVTTYSIQRFSIRQLGDQINKHRFSYKKQLIEKQEEEEESLPQFSNSSNIYSQESNKAADKILLNGFPISNSKEVMIVNCGEMIRHESFGTEGSLFQSNKDNINQSNLIDNDFNKGGVPSSQRIQNQYMISEESKEQALIESNKTSKSSLLYNWESEQYLNPKIQIEIANKNLNKAESFKGWHSFVLQEQKVHQKSLECKISPHQKVMKQNQMTLSDYVLKQNQKQDKVGQNPVKEQPQFTSSQSVQIVKDRIEEISSKQLDFNDKYNQWQILNSPAAFKNQKQTDQLICSIRNQNNEALKDKILQQNRKNSFDNNLNQNPLSQKQSNKQQIEEQMNQSNQNNNAIKSSQKDLQMQSQSINSNLSQISKRGRSLKDYNFDNNPKQFKSQDVQQRSLIKSKASDKSLNSKHQVKQNIHNNDSKVSFESIRSKKYSEDDDISQIVEDDDICVKSSIYKPQVNKVKQNGLNSIKNNKPKSQIQEGYESQIEELRQQISQLKMNRSGYNSQLLQLSQIKTPSVLKNSNGCFQNFRKSRTKEDSALQPKVKINNNQIQLIENCNCKEILLISIDKVDQISVEIIKNMLQTQDCRLDADVAIDQVQAIQFIQKKLEFRCCYDNYILLIYILGGDPVADVNFINKIVETGKLKAQMQVGSLHPPVSTPMMIAIEGVNYNNGEFQNKEFACLLKKPLQINQLKRIVQTCVEQCQFN